MMQTDPLQADPHTVRGSDIRAALNALGIKGPVEDILHTSIEPGRIAVVRIRRNEDGHIVVAGKEVATTTTDIGVDWKR